MYKSCESIPLILALPTSDGAWRKCTFYKWYQLQEAIRPRHLWTRLATPPCLLDTLSGWWFQICFTFSTRTLGTWFPIWRAYFSNGLKPPTSYPYTLIVLFWFHPNSTWFGIHLIWDLDAEKNKSDDRAPKLKTWGFKVPQLGDLLTPKHQEYWHLSIYIYARTTHPTEESPQQLFKV